MQEQNGEQTNDLQTNIAVETDTDVNNDTPCSTSDENGNNSNRFRFHVGMRNFKTALAAMLCALMYFPFDRNPTFACIGAIFGTGNDMGNSWLNGGNRLIGTVIGGFLGMILFRIYIIFYPNGGMHTPMLLFIFVGVILVVSTSLFFKWPGAIQPGGVVLCIILFNTPVDTYVEYSLNRMLDTGIGVAVALLLNLLLPRERVHKMMSVIKAPLRNIIL